MPNIKNNRESLELFLKEQVIGPGAGRNRIVRLNRDADFSFLGIGFMENKCEALNVVPGLLYSSGILFPGSTKMLPLVSEAKIKNEIGDEIIITESEELEDTVSEIKLQEIGRAHV